jgi:hypothetical protein
VLEQKVTNLENLKKENMKKTFKTFLVTAGAALATTVAQANTTPSVGVTYGSTEVGAGAASGVNFNITSIATVDGSGYLYSYTVPASGTVPGTGIDSFTVHFLDTLGVTSINSPDGWTGVLNPANVGWTHVNDTTEQETYTFFSPYAPIWGYASAQDNGQWSDFLALEANAPLSGSPLADDGVVVPNSPPVTTPDGGLTATLLGGTLLGLGALRRKLGC